MKIENVSIQYIMQYRDLNNVPSHSLRFLELYLKKDVCVLYSFRSYLDSIHTLMIINYCSLHALTNEKDSFCAVVIALMECMLVTRSR